MESVTGKYGRINHVRQQNHWSIADLARICSVSRSAAWTWIHGRVTHVNDKHLCAIADAASISFYWLKTGEEYNPNDLSHIERQVLDWFREATQEQQRIVMEILRMMRESRKAN